MTVTTGSWFRIKNYGTITVSGQTTDQIKKNLLTRCDGLPFYTHGDGTPSATGESRDTMTFAAPDAARHVVVFALHAAM